MTMMIIILMLYVIMCVIPTSFQLESPTGQPTTLPTIIPCMKGTYLSQGILLFHILYIYITCI